MNGQLVKVQVVLDGSVIVAVAQTRVKANLLRMQLKANQVEEVWGFVPEGRNGTRVFLAATSNCVKRDDVELHPFEYSEHVNDWFRIVAADKDSLRFENTDSSVTVSGPGVSGAVEGHGLESKFHVTLDAPDIKYEGAIKLVDGDLVGLRWAGAFVVGTLECEGAQYTLTMRKLANIRDLKLGNRYTLNVVPSAALL